MILMASVESWSMFTLGVVLMLLILLRRAWRYQRRAKREQHGARAFRTTEDRSTPLIDAPREVVRWQVEMHDTARELKAELDSKIRAFQALVRMAASESERLESAIQRAEELGLSVCRDTLQAVERLGGDEAALPDGVLPPSHDARLADLLSPGQRREQIYALRDAGHDSETIAAKTSTPVGEVELILSLRPGLLGGRQQV